MRHCLYNIAYALKMGIPYAHAEKVWLNFTKLKCMAEVMASISINPLVFTKRVPSLVSSHCNGF